MHIFFELINVARFGLVKSQNPKNKKMHIYIYIGAEAEIFLGWANCERKILD
jgi:hypothetical protein